MTYKVTAEIELPRSDVEHTYQRDESWPWSGVRVVKMQHGGSKILISDGSSVLTALLDPQDTAILRDEMLPQGGER